MKRRKIIFIVLDIFAAVLAWFWFWYFRIHVNDLVLFPGSASLANRSSQFWLSLLSFPLVCEGIHFLTGFYYKKRAISRLIDFFTTLLATGLAALVLYFAIIVDDVVSSQSFFFAAFFILWGILFSCTFCLRLIYTLYLYRSKLLTNILIIGSGRLAQSVVKRLPSKESHVVGFINTGTNAPTDSPAMGYMAQLEEIIQREKVDQVIIADERLDHEVIYNMVDRLMSFDLLIRWAPTSKEMLMRHVDIHNLSKEPTLVLNDLTMPAWQCAIKRTLDLVISLLGIILLSPILSLIALGIKMGSKGPVFYRQVRIGRNKRAFNILKFRTMYVDAEKDGPALSQEADIRITKIGRVLRKYRLDEIPQLFNILKGEMSIVGPRPERPFYIDKIMQRAPYYCLLYSLRPGLFSWGPIKIGYSDTVEKMIHRLDYDIIYLNNMSLYLDVKILWYSIEILLKGDGK